MARQAAAVEGSRFSHRGGRDSSQRGMPQATGETAVLLDANNQAVALFPTPGAATGSLYGFKNLSDENLKTNLQGRDAS